jgi:hypothetical protein
MEEKEKKQLTNPHRMGIERAWQTSSATPIPKILVLCIIDSEKTLRSLLKPLLICYDQYYKGK